MTKTNKTQIARMSKHITKTEFWDTIMHDVYGPRKGGAIIFVDAENARKGVAKTSCAIALARLFANAFGYDISEDDMTISGENYLKRYKDQPGKEQPSAVVVDEFVGAGSGDSRRAMSNDNLRIAKAWQMLRAKRVITLATLPDWNEADPRLRKYADYRCWCREKPIGVFQPYKVTTPFDSSASKINTEGIPKGNTERISFPNMDGNEDPLYRHLTEKKEKLNESAEWDADEMYGEDSDEPDVDKKEIRKEQKKQIAQNLRDTTEMTLQEISEKVGMSKGWVVEHTDKKVSGVTTNA